MRKYFFVKKVTPLNVDRLKSKYNNYSHFDVDIKDFEKVNDIIKTINLIVYSLRCATSHDKAADIPLIDFHVNATGTINGEDTRAYCETVFIYSTTSLWRHTK